MSSYTSRKGHSPSCPCPTRIRVENATLDDIAAVIAGLSDKVLLLRHDILGLKYLDTMIHSGSTSPMGKDDREIRPSLKERTVTKASCKRGKRVQEAGDSIHSDESSLKSFNGEYTKSKARNLIKPKSSVFKFRKSKRSKYGKTKRQEKSEYSVNDEILEQQTFSPVSEIKVVEPRNVRFSGKHKKVKKKPSTIKEFISKGRVSKSKFQKDEATGNNGNFATLILNDFQESNKLTGRQSSRSPKMLHKCQSIQKSLNLTNSVYCDCEMAPPVFRKIVRKRISRGVQYEVPKISNHNERACLNCFKSCKCSKKHKKKMAKLSKSIKSGTSMDRDSVEVIFRPEDKVLYLSERENSKLKHLSSPSDQNDVRNGRHRLKRPEIHGFDTRRLNIPLHESLKSIQNKKGISYSSKEVSKQPRKTVDREPRGKSKEKNVERQLTRYSKDPHELNEMQVEKLKHVRINDQRLKKNDQFISDSDSAKTINILNEEDYAPNVISPTKFINKRMQRMSGGGEEEYESLKYLKTQKTNVIGIDHTKNQSKNHSDWSMTKTIFKKIAGVLFSTQIPHSHDQTEETRTSRNNTIDITLQGLQCNRQINVNNIKKRLDSCLLDLNNIMLDVSFMCKENQIARSFANESK